MSEKRIEAYIQKRLAELDKGKDMQEVIHKGHLSFGIDSASFRHLPAWATLLQKKKLLVKMVWINAFFSSLMIVLIVGGWTERFALNWWKAALGILALTAVVMLFELIGSFYSLFYHFRQTEREVRKLIYQDLLHQLKKEEKELV